MKKIILLSFIALAFFGCSKSFVELFDTKSTNTKTKNGSFVFENDSLRITYHFWAEKGLMTFAIYNKSKLPLYVDWKKSSYIDNSVKLNYWVDEEFKKYKEYYGSYYYSGSTIWPSSETILTDVTGISSSTKPERITFIPPGSNFYQSKFRIMPVDVYHIGKNSIISDVPRNDRPTKSTRIYEKFYTMENSPSVFRNFLTFSFSEDFKDEFYVDNNFFISKISAMDKRHFEQFLYDPDRKGKFFMRDKNGNFIKVSPFKKETSFYIHLQ